MTREKPECSWHPMRTFVPSEDIFSGLTSHYALHLKSATTSSHLHNENQVSNNFRYTLESYAKHRRLKIRIGEKPVEEAGRMGLDSHLPLHRQLTASPPPTEPAGATETQGLRTESTWHCVCTCGLK